MRKTRATKTKKATQMEIVSLDDSDEEMVASRSTRSRSFVDPPSSIATLPSSSSVGVRSSSSSVARQASVIAGPLTGINQASRVDQTEHNEYPIPTIDKAKDKQLAQQEQSSSTHSQQSVNSNEEPTKKKR